jgi:hypothetical protein
MNPLASVEVDTLYPLLSTFYLTLHLLPSTLLLKTYYLQLYSGQLFLNSESLSLISWALMVSCICIG